MLSLEIIRKLVLVKVLCCICTTHVTLTKDSCIDPLTLHEFRSHHPYFFMNKKWKLNKKGVSGPGLKFLISLRHGLRTLGEEIAFTTRPKIHYPSQIFRYRQSLFCLPHGLKFSDVFDLCLHWVSVVRGVRHLCTSRTDINGAHHGLSLVFFIRIIRGQRVDIVYHQCKKPSLYSLHPLTFILKIKYFAAF